MTDYYVDHLYGDDSGAGTESDPWQTIEKAVTSIGNGDTIWVKATEDYTEEHGSTGAILNIASPGTPSSPRIIIGYHTTPGDNGIATLDASVETLTNAGRTNGALLGGIAHWIIKNLEFTGASGDGFAQADYGLTTINCRFTNNGTNGHQCDRYLRSMACQYDNNTERGLADVGGSSYYMTILACVLKENGLEGGELNPAGTFIDCVAFNNQKTGGDAQLWVNHGYITARCIGCTVDGYGNSSSVGFENSNTPGFNTVAVNNIFFDCGIGLSTDVSCLVELAAYNLYAANDTDVNNFSPVSDQVGSISSSEDPFTNSAINDYSLTSDSEAKAAGIDGRWTQEFWESFEDSTNPPSGMNSYKDIGAWQRQEPAGGGGGRRTRIKEHGI